MGRASPAESPSPANPLNRAIERVNAAVVQPTWSAMLLILKPRADGQPNTMATAGGIDRWQSRVGGSRDFFDLVLGNPKKSLCNLSCSCPYCVP
jgi:hypothetical protein